MAGFFFLSALWTSAFAGNGEEIYDQMPDLGDQEFRMTYGYMDRVGGTHTRFQLRIAYSRSSDKHCLPFYRLRDS